jgi:hypothetical protein
MTEEGNGTPEVRVKFGGRPSQNMPLMWAERMLTLWCERDPQRFGTLLAEVATGVEMKQIQRASK